ADDSILEPGERRTCLLPISLTAGETVIEIEAREMGAGSRDVLQTISLPVLAGTGRDPGRSLLSLGEAPTPEMLTRWFETVIAVQRAAASSPEFYQPTAQALVELVGLDQGLVLLRKGAAWEVAARFPGKSGAGRAFSHTILRNVVEERRTFYQPMA